MTKFYTRYLIETITNSYFKIDASKGVIKNITNIDYEKINIISFSVYAAISRNLSQVGYARVEVKVNDQNDNPPIVKNKNIDLQINEDLLVKSIIYDLYGVATDADSLHGNIAYNIIRGNENSYFLINDKHQIILNKELDFDFRREYKLDVNASDGELSTSFLVTVNIADVNEHNPIFENTSYVFTIMENTNLENISITAHDQDSNDEIQYQTTNETASLYFTIDPTSGVITNTTILDYEHTKVFIFTVMAIDNGRNPRRGCTIITFNIIDQNDNKPFFKEYNYVKSISESYARDREILQIYGYDNDSNSNGKINYFLNQSAANYFAIGKETGIMSLKKPLDFETETTHNVTVKISDKGTPILWSDRSAHITIKSS